MEEDKWAHAEYHAGTSLTWSILVTERPVWLKQKLAAREVGVVLNGAEDKGRSGPHRALGYTSNLGLCSKSISKRIRDT